MSRLHANEARASIGFRIPAFEAPTNMGQIDFYAFHNGDWVIVFFHMLRNSLACCHKLMQTQKTLSSFKGGGVRFLGVCLDGQPPGFHWNRPRYGTQRAYLPIPIIHDQTQAIARLFGYRPPDAHVGDGVQGLYFIDPDGVFRCVVRCNLCAEGQAGIIEHTLLALHASVHYPAPPAACQPSPDGDINR